MERYIENILTFLPLLGVNLFDVVVAEPRGQTAETVVPLTGVTYYLKTQLTSATGKDDSRGFTVFEGSLGRRETKVMSPGYLTLRQRLFEDGILVPHGADQIRLTRTYAFDSPSSAADVMSGASKNGREFWKDANGKSLKDHQAEVTSGNTDEDDPRAPRGR